MTRTKKARAPKATTAISKRDITRWIKWWDFEQPDAVIHPKLRTLDRGIAGLLIHRCRRDCPADTPDLLPWPTIAALAEMAEGTGSALARHRFVWAGIVADWAFRVAAPAWLSLLPDGVSPRYDNGLLPTRQPWWANDLIKNLANLVDIMAELEASRRATSADRAEVINAIHARLYEVLTIGHHALGFVITGGQRNEGLPYWFDLTRPRAGETNVDRVAMAARVAATVPTMLELVVTTKAGDDPEYVSQRCQWPALPAAPRKRRKAA